MELMKKRTLLSVMISLPLAFVILIPELETTGARENSTNIGYEDQATQTRDLAQVLGAPFKVIGKLLGGNKTHKPISKISDKDIARFESSKVSRVNDAQTPAKAIAAAADADAILDHVQRGRAFLKADQLNEAIAELTTAVSMNPKSGEAQTLLGVAYDRKGLGGFARQAFEAALQDPDDRAQHLNNLGFLEYRQGDIEQSIKHLKRAAQLKPGDSRIWNNLTMAQLTATKFDDAYKSALHVSSEFDSRVRIATYSERHGYMKEAIRHYEKALAIKPNSIGVLARLAPLYAATGQDQKELVAHRALTDLQTVAGAPNQ